MKEIFKLLKERKFKALFIERTHNGAIQFFRYLFVGGAATVVDWSALWLFYSKFHIWEYLSVAIAFCFGLFANYFLSNAFVFQDISKVKNHYAKFSVYLITGLIGLGMTELLMVILDEFFGVHYMVSKIITTAIVFAWNFGSKKVILYRKRDD